MGPTAVGTLVLGLCLLLIGAQTILGMSQTWPDRRNNNGSHYWAGIVYDHNATMTSYGASKLRWQHS